MKVVLDAIIPRDDFEVEETTGSSHGTNIATLGVQNLKQSDFFLASIRKPDFQRETNEWTAQKIIGLITSFIEGDLIPSVILWQSPTSNTFVIDGAHRLSALAAWINDDYGDGSISKKFFNGIIPDEQIQVAEKTRKAVNRQVGAFRDYELGALNPEKVKSEIAGRSRLLGMRAIQVQWVTGDASKAEESFFKINQEAAPINKTELRLLRSRKKPNGIAARAISRSGTGHKYWSTFTKEAQERVEQTSKEVNEMLFTPPLKSPVKSLDLPVGGKLYSQQTLSLILEFTNISNSIQDETNLENDSDGTQTNIFLSNCRRLARRINSTHASSLGLHPAVYFYSDEGKYKPASFYSVVLFVNNLSSNPESLRKFTKVRKNFEEILLQNDYVTEQIIRKWRGAIAGYPYVAAYFQYLIDELSTGKSNEDIISGLTTHKDYKFIARPAATNNDPPAVFTQSAKSKIFIREALSAALRCKICEGLIHVNAITFDHIQRKSEGGLGDVDNGQLAHPYCNTTYKN